MRAAAPARPRSRRPLIPAVVVAILVVAFGAIAVHWAVENTLTRHSEVDPGSSMVLTVHAERQAAAEHDEEELVEAMVAMCQLEVGGEADPDSLRLVDDDADLYSVVFTPALDASDRRQLKGCIQDLRIDHFKASVVAMEPAAP